MFAQTVGSSLMQFLMKARSYAFALMPINYRERGQQKSGISAYMLQQQQSCIHVTTTIYRLFSLFRFCSCLINQFSFYNVGYMKRKQRVYYMEK